MRFLKSLILVLFCTCVGVANAQDTAFISRDTTFTTTKDTTPIFHADKPTGIVAWNERTIPDTTLQQLRRDDAFWYANAEFKRKTLSDKTRQNSFLFYLFRQQWFYNLLWTIIIVSFIVVIVLFLMQSNPWLFRNKAASLIESEESVITENIFSINYDAELKKALAQNNFRLAVRLQYLQLLKLLSDKELIQYKEGRTNSDYLLQLYPTPYYKNFSALTRHFEYAWYGQFSITPAVYQVIENDFVNLKHSMGI